MALIPPTQSARKFWGLFYGGPGTGKSRIAGAYPDEWGEGVYLAVDNDGSRLDSILPQHRSRLHVYQFDGASPIDNMNQFAIENWRKVHPKAGVLIVDTLSRAAKKMLVYAAKQNYFEAKGRLQFGPKSAEISQGLPMPGDYGGTQYLLRNWIDALFLHQRDMHIIVVCHQYEWFPNEKSPAGATAFGGPDTIGSALVQDLASEFPAVVRLDVDHITGLDGKVQSRYVAHSAMTGIYTARIKEGDEKGNPMPKVVLAANPRNWYDQYLTHFMREEHVNAS